MTLTVGVVAFPDGTTTWIDSPSPAKYALCCEPWGAQNPGYKEAGLGIGLVEIEMTAPDFMNIPDEQRFKPTIELVKDMDAAHNVDPDKDTGEEHDATD